MIAYHGTSKKAAQQIVKHGFDVKQAGARQKALHGSEVAEVQGIYLTTNRKLAEQFYAGSDLKRPGVGQGAVVIVNVTGRIMAEKAWWRLRKTINDSMGLKLYDPRRFAAIKQVVAKAQDMAFAGFFENSEELVVFDPRNVKVKGAYDAHNRNERVASFKYPPEIYEGTGNDPHDGVLVRSIPVTEIVMLESQAKAIIADLKRGENSNTAGKPLLWYNLDKKQLTVDDGNHRIFQQWLKGKTKIDAIIYSSDWHPTLRSVYSGEKRFDWKHKATMKLSEYIRHVTKTYRGYKGVIKRGSQFYNLWDKVPLPSQGRTVGAAGQAGQGHQVRRLDEYLRDGAAVLKPQGLALHDVGGLHIVYKWHRAQAMLKSWDGVEDLIMGVIDIRDNHKHHADEVERVWARKGYGPMMYLIAAMDADKRGIIPDQTGRITPGAKKLWQSFVDGAGSKYVTAIPLTADTQLKEPYLRVRLVAKGRPVDIGKMRHNDHFVFKKDPYGELETALLETAESLAYSAMHEIYG